MDAATLAESLRSLVTQTEALIEALELEKRALVARDLGALAGALEIKQRLIEAMEVAGRSLAGEPLDQRIAESDPASRSELDALHKALLTAADTAREYNAVNGKIVQRAQKSTRELIHLISGTDAEVLYGEQGQTSATAKGTAIARA